MNVFLDHGFPLWGLQDLSSHLCPSIKFPKNSRGSNSLLLKIPLFFNLQGKNHDVFHMNIPEVSMSQACLGE